MPHIVDRSPSFIAYDRSDLEQSITSRFEKMVERHSDRIAIRRKATAVTYDELNRASNQVAHTLLNRHGRAEGAVGLLIQDERQAIVAILGVLKAGELYVPLDRAFPRERLQSIVEDCRLQVLLTQKKDLDWAMDLAPECTVIALEDIDPQTSVENLGSAIQPVAIAAIFYTSGTTGQPKGVVQDHRSVLHRVMLSTNTFGVGCSDRLTLLNAPTYSASLRNLFTALLNGAALYPFRVLEDGISELGGWLSQEKITVYHSVPSVFRRWVSTLAGSEDLSHLRVIELGGEAVTASDVGLYKRYFPATCVFVNGLSSNETGTISRYLINRSTEIAGNTVPVGYPVEDKEVLLLDDAGREVVVGEVGEIAVRSRFMSPGYWKRPDLTAAVFVVDPARHGERIYRTGDLGSFLPDGCLLHKGRRDFRAKIRGIRVESEEVEAALHSQPAVLDAAVVIHDHPAGGQTLTAHVALKKVVPAPSATELRTRLAGTLPDFMVPSAFVFHEDLPRLLNGKIDRRALREAARARPVRDTPFEPPLDSVECRLTNIWAAVLRVHSIGVRDNFLELGGDSLAAAEVSARIEKAFDRRLPASQIVQTPTVEQLAAILRRDSTPTPTSSLIKLQSGGGKLSVFCFPFGGGFAQELYYFAALAPRLRQEYSFYGVVARGSDGVSTPHRSVEEMAAAYVEEITTVQATGPYLLLGDCLGAPVAYETARQLRALGRDIGTLCLFEAWGSEPWLDRFLGRALSARVRHHVAPLRHSWRRRAQRIPHHRAELRRLDSNGARLRYAIKALLSGSRLTVSEIRDDPTQYPRRTIADAGRTAESDARHLKQAADAYDLAVRRYRRRPYDGTITLIATDESCKVDPLLGWRPNDQVEIHRIPGRHDTYMRDQAHLIIDVLRACFEKVERTLQA